MLTPSGKTIKAEGNFTAEGLRQPEGAGSFSACTRPRRPAPMGADASITPSRNGVLPLLLGWCRALAAINWREVKNIRELSYCVAAPKTLARAVEQREASR